jgi:drug/metabolite transporter (DMT)-like permease
VSRRGWVLFALVGVIWGVPFLLIKIADSGVSVPVLVFARVFAGSVILLPTAVRRGRLRALWPHWRWLTAFAAVEVIVPWLLLSAAERRLSSSLSGLLIAAVPVIGMGVAKLAGGTERLTMTRWLGLIVGICGVGLLMAPGASGGDTMSILEVLGTALCYATGPVIADKKLANIDGLGATAACLGFAAVIYAPAAALTWPQAMPSVQVLGALASLAVVCTALAFMLYFKLIAEVGPVRATVITYINPAVAVALGVAVLAEPLTLGMAVSFALILAGSVLATRSTPNTNRPQAQPKIPHARPCGGPQPDRLHPPSPNTADLWHQVKSPRQCPARGNRRLHPPLQRAAGWARGPPPPGNASAIPQAPRRAGDGHRPSGADHAAMRTAARRPTRRAARTSRTPTS